ncbi:MAG: metallophosphoesterase [Gammaproteobacteria bacterium]|jgi:hypothetical protein
MKLFHSVFYQSKASLWSFFAVFSILTMAITLTGCNSDSGHDDGSSADKTGEVIIDLTDAPGGFTTYTVDVVSLTLTKANGAVVETLPTGSSTRVDFAQYTEMTEFLTAATVPGGTYVSATLTLDYSNADIQVEDDNGNAVPVSVIQDEQGSAIGEWDLDVRLEGQRSLFVASGIPAHLSLDFDLNATNIVDLNNGSPIVTVSPKLLAEVNRESPKIHRARGPLKSVDTADSSFRVIIRPFIHVLSGGEERFGTLKVTTTDDTVFDINGNVSQGSTGLTELSQQTPLTAVVVLGDLKFDPRRFEATEVRAGTSVAGGTLDVVTGNVTSRSGDVLTIKGATLIRQDGSVVFNDEVEVTVGDNTKVRKQLSMAQLSKSDISIGQRLTVFGTVTDDQIESLTLDATQGYARLLFTTLRATVVDTSPMTISLQSIDGRRIALFDFTGSGASENADPQNYAIDTGSINLSNISVDDVVKVRGFVKPFAKAEDADFTAQTIVNVSTIPGTLLVGWPDASTTAITTNTDAGNMTLDLTGVGLFHHISRAGVLIDLAQLATDTTIEPNSQAGVYFIHQNGVWQLHTLFSNYLSDLQSRLDSGGAVRGVSARGTFEDNTAMMTVKSMTVHLM